MSGLWGFYGGPDGNYHNHGHQNPLIPYDGMIYWLKSNCVIAYGPRSGPLRKQPLISREHLAPRLAVRNADFLKQRLFEEIQKTLDAGHLQPGYYNAGQMIARYDHMCAYFQIPADTFYVLTRALPHVPEAQRQALQAYLQKEFREHPPTQIAAYGWEGAPRTWAEYPPEAQAMLGKIKDAPVLGGRWMWPFPPHNFYALWKYAEAGLGDAGQLLQAARGRLEVPPRIPEEMLLQNVWQLNMYIAGYHGYLGLQKLAGQAPDRNVSGQLQRLEKLWAQKVKIRSPWCDASGQRTRDYHKQRINIARCFIWMTPELGDYLRRNALQKIKQGVEHLNDVAP